MRYRWIFSTVALFLTGCEQRPDAPVHGGPAEPVSAAGNAAASTSEQSIIRQDVLEEAALPVEAETPETLVLRFTEDGELDPTSTDALEDWLADAKLEGEESILLRGHSDSRGNDDVNRKASAVRAERVREVLVEKGIGEDRIEIIALGEDRPFAPNAHPDGTDNPEGRALNRRVDVEMIATSNARPDVEGAADAAEPRERP